MIRPKDSFMNVCVVCLLAEACPSVLNIEVVLTDFTTVVLDFSPSTYVLDFLHTCFLQHFLIIFKKVQNGETESWDLEEGGRVRPNHWHLFPLSHLTEFIICWRHYDANPISVGCFSKSFECFPTSSLLASCCLRTIEFWGKVFIIFGALNDPFNNIKLLFFWAGYI